MNKKIIYSIGLTIFFIILIIMPRECVAGASAGLNLWFTSLIPSILPFIILSNIMISLNTTQLLAKIIHPIIKRLFKTSLYGSYCILMGFFCGYPVGAKVINDLLSQKKISIDEAQYLFNFSNNASPGFIQSYIIFSLLDASKYKFYGLIFVYLPAIIFGILSRNKYPKSFSFTDTQVSNYIKPSITIIDNCILEGFIIIIKLGGYLIFFSIIANIVDKAILLPIYIKTLIICLLEITYGTYYISITNFPLLFKLFLCMAATVFGGLSTIMQTKSVCSCKNLSMKKYIFSRAIMVIISVIIYITILII